jgi:uncharacterized delta-60 repeat protein
MDRRRLNGFGSLQITLLLACLGLGLILGVSSLSASSGGAGTVRSQDGVGALGVEPDGTLVVAGSSRVGGPTHGRRFALARYTAAGKLDRRFGTGGKVLTGFGLRFVRPRFPGGAGVASLAIRRDGKIVVAGYAYRPPGLQYSAFALARYTVSGRLDRTFGRKGTVLTSFGSRTSSGVSAVAIAPNGKIVAVGSGHWGGGCDCLRSHIALARYGPRGRLDPSFGRGGRVVTGFGARNGGEVEAAAIQPDGKIVVAADYFGAGTDFGVARYNDDGTLDRTFGTGGRVVTKVGEISAYAAGVVVQPDGKIVVAGTASVGLSGRTALVRYNANGALDPTFGRGGISHTKAGYVSGLAIQHDRKLVTTRDPFGLARFLKDGSLDGSFGRNGKVRTDFQGRASADEVAVRADGKIVVAGTVGSYPRGDFTLARYTSSGSLDDSFGSGGKVLTDFGSLWGMRGR